jgi:solute carrier family 30 (zinc transporter), member 2
VSDLHVWSLKPGIPLLAAHVCVVQGADPNWVLDRVTALCRSKGIEHSTIQVDVAAHGS